MSLPSHVVFSPNDSYLFWLSCHFAWSVISVLCIHSLLHWLFSFHLLSPTHMSNIWRINFLNFFIVFSFPFFLSPLWAFSKLNLYSIASNSLSTNFMPTIWPVCNLITPTKALLKTCSFKSHQCLLHCQCQRPLFFYLSSLLYFITIYQHLLELLGFSLSLYITLISGTRHNFTPLSLFQVYFPFLFKLDKLYIM